MLDVDVMLGQREGCILGFGRRCILLLVFRVLSVPVVVQRQAPVIVPPLHSQFDVIVLSPCTRARSS